MQKITIEDVFFTVKAVIQWEKIPQGCNKIPTTGRFKMILDGVLSFSRLRSHERLDRVTFPGPFPRGLPCDSRHAKQIKKNHIWKRQHFN